MNKLMQLSLIVGLILGLVACTAAPKEDPDPIECGEMTLADVNAFLNESADMGEGSIANVVAVIPINHVDGPRNESKFYAFVQFKYKARDYIKYQVTYLSCTCRAASVNYWQTAYIELTMPESKAADDVVVKFLSFDRDASDHYTVGFWGDSDPTPEGVTYKVFKNFISYFIGKNYGYIKTLDTMDDITQADYQANGREMYSLDTFTGSSVSTNNIVRMLNAIIEYHLTDEFFPQ